MAKTVIDVLKEKIEAERASAIDLLLREELKTSLRTKKRQGLVRGHDACLQHIEDLLRNLEYEDE